MRFFSRGVVYFVPCLLVLFGCASTQLNHNTLDLAGTVGDIQTQQVLYNLSILHDNPGAIPTHVDLAAGTASTTNSISPTLAAPLVASAQTLVQSTANLSNSSAVVTTANEVQNIGTRSATSLSVQAQDAWTQSWSYDPVVDGDELRRLRALYKYALGVQLYPCPELLGAETQKHLKACSDNELIYEYPTVTKTLSVAYANNDATSSTSIYCQNIGVTSTQYLTNSKGNTIDNNGFTLTDFVNQQEKLHPWTPDKDDVDCVAGKPTCPGTSSGIAGKITKEQWDQHWNAAFKPGRIQTTCSSLTDSIQLPDEAYLHRPSCILCLSDRARTAVYVSRNGDKSEHLVVNEHLAELRGSTSKWLYWDEDAPDREFLGWFGKHALFVRRAEKWKLSEFTLFVMTATAQSAAANAANGTSGAQKKGGNNPGPAQIIGTSPNTVQFIQPLGRGVFQAQ